MCGRAATLENAGRLPGNAAWPPSAGSAYALHCVQHLRCLVLSRPALDAVVCERVGGPQERRLLLAGEIGFTPCSQLGDVWSSDDGGGWTQLTAPSASCQASGHGFVVVQWDCASESCGNFDFWPAVVQDSIVLTLGGSNAYSTSGKLWADAWELSYRVWVFGVVDTEAT